MLRIAKISGLFLIALLVGSSSSEPPPSSVLRGLDKLYVHVSFLSDSVLDAGVEAEDLVREASLVLSRAGLVVLSAESYRPDTPFLALALDTVELPSGELAFHASLELQEEVRLARDRHVSTYGSTWYTSRIGVSTSGSLSDDCVATVQALVDEFLAEWIDTVP